MMMLMAMAMSPNNWSPSVSTLERTGGNKYQPNAFTDTFYTRSSSVRLKFSLATDALAAPTTTGGVLRIQQNSLRALFMNE